MKKPTRDVFPLWNLKCNNFNFQLFNRRCQQFGFAFISVITLFFIIYYGNFVPLSSNDILGTNLDHINSSLSVSLHQTRTCPRNVSIVKEAPSSLRCGMTVNAIGRLGNLMGQYATLVALSEINNRPAVILPEMADILRLYFANISLPTMTPEERAFWESRWNVVGLNDWMEPQYEHLNAVFTYLYGYPCSWTFYHHIRDRIVQEFRFHDYILEWTHRMLNYYRQGRDSVTFVGVHNRRGDYVSLIANSYRGVVADAGFFQKAFDYFESKYPDAVFLVVSDDMDWCKNNMNNSRDNIYFVGSDTGGIPIYDLAVMANCNHSIITIGTFGYWGAYLAGGEAIYLFNYTMPNSSFLNVLNYDTAYLPVWMPIAANFSAFKEPTPS